MLEINENVFNRAASILKERFSAYKTEIASSLPSITSEIKEVIMDTRRICFDVVSIDGSYCVLWNHPVIPVSLSIVRIAAVTRKYDPNLIKIETIFNDFNDYIVVIDEKDKKTIIIDKTGDVEEIEMASNTVNHEITKIMENKEWKTALKTAETNHGIMIFRDSVIRSPSEQRVLEPIKIMRSCEENGNVFVGIVKDSGMRDINGFVTNENLLGIISKQNDHRGFTGYYQVHPGDNRIKAGTCYARLHPRALKWIRVDYQVTTLMDVDEILRTIACYSQVNTMPGIPFPPLCAHEIAIKIAQLKQSSSFYNEYIMKLLKSLHFSDQEIIEGLTKGINGEGALGNLHDYLDGFTSVRPVDNS